LWYIGSMLIASSSNQAYLNEYCSLNGVLFKPDNPLYAQNSCGTCHANTAAPYSGGALLGIGAGILWTAQGAIMMSYPTENRKGTYIAVFWIIFNMGGVIGSVIPFALNFSSTASGVSNGTYIAFMVLMACGAILGLFMAPPSKVIKEDSTHVVIDPVENVFKEFLEILKLFTNIDMLTLMLMFFMSNFFYSYQFDHLNGFLFNTRTKAFKYVYF
jgi:MFS family permease